MRNIRRAGDYWKRILSKSETIYYELFEQRENITKEIKKNIFEKYVEIVNIETSTKCNRKCLYCPLSEYGGAGRGGRAGHWWPVYPPGIGTSGRG